MSFCCLIILYITYFKYYSTQKVLICFNLLLAAKYHINFVLEPIEEQISFTSNNNIEWPLLYHKYKDNK